MLNVTLYHYRIPVHVVKEPKPNANDLLVKIKKKFMDIGAPSPQQLRSDDHPLGIPGLSPHDAAKVSKANILASW